MLYLGGKGRLGKTIARTILASTPRRKLLIEPFLGGGNTFRHLAPSFRRVLTGDVHEDLVLMWRAAAGGWIPPSSITEAEYIATRSAQPSAYRGFVGFGCSYGGKWWGGLARNKVVGMQERSHPDYYARLASKDVESLGKLLAGSDIRCCSFESWTPDVDDQTVVYADPPYAKTTGYKGGFDHELFWRTMEGWVTRGTHVFVSEYAAPYGWQAIWSKEQRRKVSGGSGDMTTEKLFTRMP